MFVMSAKINSGLMLSQVNAFVDNFFLERKTIVFFISLTVLFKCFILKSGMNEFTPFCRCLETVILFVQNRSCAGVKKTTELF